MAAPVFLDREKTTDKACKLIKEAGGQGAELIVFPEVYIPAYPYWIWLGLMKKLKLYLALLAISTLFLLSACTKKKSCSELLTDY